MAVPVAAAVGGYPAAPAIPAGVTTGTTGGVVPIGISAGDGMAPGGRGWTIGAGGTACHVALALAIVWVQSPEPKNRPH
jgi:hypothetical protein